MSLEQLESLTAKIKKLEDFKKNQQENLAFRTRRQQIQNALVPLSTYLAVVQEFERRNILVQIDRATVHYLLQKTQAARQQYQASRATIIVDDAQFWQLLKRFVETDLKQVLMAAWVAHIDGLFAPVPISLLDLLKQIDTYHMMIADIDERITAMHQMQNKLPQGEGDFARLESLTAQIHERLRRLPLDDFPPAVQQFLHAIMDGNASFAQLTDEVLDWIRTQHIEESLHVSFSAAGGEQRYAPR